MTDKILRLFVKGYDAERAKDDPVLRRKCGSAVAVIGIVVNLLLAVIKLVAGLLSGAISITADAVNNISDALSQIVSLIAFKISARPADREHPFGHARIEYVASMIVSFLVLLVGCRLLGESVSKILHPSETLFSWVSVGVLGASVIVKLWLALFNKKVAKKIDSSVMRATSADSLSDAVATSAVLVATLIYKFTSWDPDGYMGVVVAILILVAGVRILNETKNSILGGAPSEETVNTIRVVVSEYPEALGIHDLVVHSYGAGRNIASLHVEVDGSQNVFDIHDVIDTMEKRLRDEYGIEATIHMDPIAVNDPMIAKWKGQIEQIAADVEHTLRIHDFRMVPGNTHTNLIFDVSASFEVKMSDADIIRKISDRVSEIEENYFCVITVDRE
jgi:cation diffusion facilitator family transporter